METKKVEQSLSHSVALYNSLRRYHIGRVEESFLPPLEDYVSPNIAIDEQNCCNVASANDALRKFEEVRSQVESMNDWADRTRKRLEEKDPITNVPRYGPKTAARLQQLLQLHEALCSAIQFAITSSENGCYYSILRAAAESENELMMENTKLHLENPQRELELKQRRLSEEHERAARAAKQMEEENIARLAEQSRQNRLDAKRRAEEGERQRETQLEASVTKGVAGAKIQLDILRESCEADDFLTAVKALYTLFNQIVKNPENIAHRRIRRDNKKFVSDIGRHEAGCCFLIAAGYQFEVIEEVKCLYLPEPDLEKDMSSWTIWFDSLKDIFLLLSTETSGSRLR